VLQRLNARVGRRWRWIMTLALALVVAFCAVTARLFVWPSTGMPARVSAIVVIGGLGDRAPYGVQLAREDRASYLVFSMGLNWIPPGICDQHVASAKVICYQPDPDTTKGEAEGAARLAKQYDWRSIVLVTTRDQAWRARLTFGRCFAGPIYNVTAPLSWYKLPAAIAYEWAATVKAEVVDTSC
jgi:uncharacterized SAM-binding protein YcdF (DUF218 family)